MFIFENKAQADFYKMHQLRSIDMNNISRIKNKFDYLFIDSKDDINESVLKINSKNKIHIDPLNNVSENIDFVVMPSFYATHNYDEKNNNYFYGSEFVILDPRIYKLKLRDRKNKKLVLSFGGSDPNNISLKFLKAIRSTKYINDVILVLGPGYKHCKNKLTELIDPNQIISNPENIFEILCKFILLLQPWE